MKIAGKEIDIKIVIGVAVLGALLVGYSTVSDTQQQSEIEKRREELSLNEEESPVVSAYDSLSESDRLQYDLEEIYGAPMEGFRWTNEGELVALSDETMSAEDVMWSYLRGMSLLDFSAIAKYSQISLVKSTYEHYYSDTSLGNTSSYSQFLRKCYDLTLKSLEIESVTTGAMFADGTTTMTVELKVLDLTDKDFWQKDYTRIMEDMSTLYTVEGDSEKANQYIYEYIYDEYKNGTVGKKDYTLNFKLVKLNQGGWLIADDTDLNSVLNYEKGVNVAEYIFEAYDDYSK